MTPALARLKRGLREAVVLCGGKSGAAMTVGLRSDSHAGSWATAHHPAFPSIAQAYALDEVAVCMGKQPPIVSALARELGGVFLPLPQASGDDDALSSQVMTLAKELGDVSGAMAAALADGVVKPAEALATLDQLHELELASAKFRQALQAIVDGEKR